MKRENSNINISKISNYGLNKLISENIVKHYAKKYIILRLGPVLDSRIKKNHVYDIINSVENESETDNTSIIDMIAKSLSKKNAVGKKTLKKVEQERILDDLFCCKENLISPFGKKIFFSLTINEIDNKFKI